MSHRALIQRNRGLSRLLLGQIPADFANWLALIAMLSVLTFEWHAPTQAYAWYAVALGAPYLIVGLFAGVLVDRLPVRWVMILSNSGRGLVYIAMIWADGWVVLVLLVALISAIDSFFTPAKQAAIQILTKDDDRMAAVGLSYAINQASKIVAPALGGGLLALSAPSVVFGITALISFAAAFILSTLPAMTRKTQQQGTGMFSQAVEGLALVWRIRDLRWAVGLMAGGFFSIFLYEILMAPLVQGFGQTTQGFGLTISAVGVGGVVGALWVAGRPSDRPFLLMGLGLISGGLLVASGGLAQTLNYVVPLYVLLVGFTAVGVTTAFSFVPARTIIQQSSNDRSIARITALSEGLNRVAIITAPFIGAAVAEMTSIGMAFILGGALSFCLGVSAVVKHRALTGRGADLT